MQAYLIVEEGGDYDDHYEHVLGVCMDRDRAQIHCDDFTRIQKNRVELAEKLYEFHDSWIKEHSGERCSAQEYVEVPRWPAGLAEKYITLEMREERERLNKRNQEISAENVEADKPWLAAMEEARQRFLDGRELEYCQDLIQEARKIEWFNAPERTYTVKEAPLRT